MDAQLSEMWDVKVWFLRELVAIALIIFFAGPLHTVSDGIWTKIRNKFSVIVPRQQRVEVFVLCVAVQLAIIFGLSVYFIL